MAIVGASIAGLAAARAASDAGARTLLLERRTAPRDSPPPAAIAFEALWPEPSFLRDAVLARYRGVRLRAGRSQVDLEARARFYDRPRLDQRLSEWAQRSGAEVRFGAGPVRVERGRVAWNGHEAAAHVVVLADGFPSLASRWMRPVRNPEAVRFGAAWSTPRSLRDPSWIELGFRPEAPGGRTQLNPLPDRTLFWIFHRGPSHDGAHLLPQCLARHVSLPNPDPTAWTRQSAGTVDPVFALPGEIVGDGMMVVGGGAGQGGLELGFRSGLLAGQAAAKAALAGAPTRERLRALYERPWKERWLPGLARFAMLFDRLSALSGPEWDALLRPWKDRRLALADLVDFLDPRAGRRWMAGLRLWARRPLGARGLKAGAALLR